MIFSMKVNINVFCKLVVSLLQVKARHTKSTQNSKFVTSLQYLRKKGGNEVDFCIHINIKLSYNFVPLISVGMARPAQVTQNNKFAKSL